MPLALGFQCEQTGSSTVYDTLGLERRVGEGYAVGVAFTKYHGAHLGLRLGFDFMHEALRNSCQPTSPFQPDSMEKNSQVCASYATNGGSLDVAALSGTLLFRVSATHAISPYVGLGVGLAATMGETLAASGAFQYRGQALDRPLVRDSSADAVRPVGRLEFGLTVGSGTSSRVRLSVTDYLVSLERLLGPAPQTASGLPESAPHSTGFRHTFVMTLGLDFVLESRPGHRY